eukprot:6724669-Prymnesium_polylepis.1
MAIGIGTLFCASLVLSLGRERVPNRSLRRLHVRASRRWHVCGDPASGVLPLRSRDGRCGRQVLNAGR